MEVGAAYLIDNGQLIIDNVGCHTEPVEVVRGISYELKIKNYE